MVAQSQRKKLADLQRRLFASRFFTISVLLHFILVLTVGTTTLVRQAMDAPDFHGESEGGSGFVAEEAESAAPPEQTTPPEQQVSTFEVTTPTASTEAASMDVITSAAASETSFSLPSFPGMAVSPSATTFATQGPTGPAISGVSAPNPGKLSKEQKVAIRNFTKSWAPAGSKGGGRGSNPKQREFVFTAYLAKYKGGDWNSTNSIAKDGKITKGSLPNLLYLMNKQSNKRIQALPHAMPLDLSSDEIFTIKPPFIFFTGHRDFVLTEKEVENLRTYVTLGGCIWGDSSLPGNRSRFDIAFRREMRRVIPDKDKDWEVLPANHALYTKKANLYYPEMTTPPPGINFYAEPVYALKYVNEVAVIYTANDYGDMWQVALTADWKYDLSRDEKHQFVAMSDRLWYWRGVYYRNISEQSVAATYKFGTNLVIHLLTRWEDHVADVPDNL